MSEPNGHVVLSIPEDKYKFILKTIEEQKNFLFKLGMHPLVKQEALRGLRIIGNILTTNKKEKT